MDLQVGLKKLLKKGEITNELDFQRATIMDRKLRLLVQEFPDLAVERNQLRSLLVNYENTHWVNENITDQKVKDSDRAAELAEKEWQFFEARKIAIRSKLKEVGLSQKGLGEILNHTSATYVSELINGINPFTLNDLVVIHTVLNIDLNILIPTILTQQVRNRVINAITKLNNPKLMKTADWVLA